MFSSRVAWRLRWFGPTEAASSVQLVVVSVGATPTRIGLTCTLRSSTEPNVGHDIGSRLLPSQRADVRRELKTDERSAS